MQENKIQRTLEKERYDAVIFDLDGVITETARLHSSAWKQMFDAYLDGRGEREKREYRPFDPESDYTQYVDGKPRYEGVRSFLASRDIDLPYGNPTDPPGKETVCGLGNKENEYFLRRLQQDGVEVYEDATRFIDKLKRHAIMTAVVSSSKNCVPVLEAARLKEVFDAKIDGVDSEQLGLEGKPQPDIFLKAAERLSTPPDRAVVVEDAVAGVQAAKAGRFHQVIGIDRKGRTQQLRDNGADVVIESFDGMEVAASDGPVGGDGPEVLDAGECAKRVEQAAEGRPLAMFLDYDGTLTPIVSRPDLARLSDRIRQTVARLAQECTVGIISGRDLQDVQEKARIDGIVYAGSHGFDIEGPGGMRKDLPEARALLPLLETASEELRRQLQGIEGIHFEPKKFSLAIHYRQVRDSEVHAIRDHLRDTVAQHPQLRLSEGKKVYELQPDIRWDKGKALLWLLDALGLDIGEIQCVYIGDDVTDEDAFGVLEDQGIGILVSEEPSRTKARYVLRDPDEVGQFLALLVASMQGERHE